MTATIDYPVRAGSLRMEALHGHDETGLLVMERAVRRVVDYVAEQGQGKFLISGFGGVGKSSLVQRALHEIQRKRAANGRSVLLLELPADTLDDPQIVAKRLLGHLRWADEEGRVKFTAAQRTQLQEAFEGAAATNVERAREQGRAIEGSAGVKAPLEFGVKASETMLLKQKANFAQNDVSTSLLELSELLSNVSRPNTIAAPQSFWSKLFAPVMPPHPPLPVVVIDRIEKWSVVEALANLFAARGVVFFVVVPPEVRTEWMRQEAAGFEELHGFQDIYLSCLWDDMPRLLVKCLAHEYASAEAVALYPKLIGFLTFASGGIPRKCVEILLKHEEVDEQGRRVVRFDRRALNTIEFYHRVFEILNRREAEILSEYFANYDDADKDRSRRCMIASAREIISRGAIPVSNPLGTMTELALALRPPEQDHIVERVIDALLDEGVLVRTEGTYTLSTSARERVAEGRAILGTGILPRIARPIDDSTQLVPSPRRDNPPRLSGKRPSASAAIACSRCGTEFDRQDSFCPNCGTELLEARIGEPERAPDKIRDTLTDVLGGQYEIKGLLGSGGMAHVYHGVHRQLLRRVAIKVLRPEMTFGDQSRSRFLREAQVSAALSHPNIGAVYDFGETYGLIYFVMQFIQGMSLDQRIHESGALSMRDAGEILVPAANALAYAHRRNVVHRDIKPANILIADEDRQPFLVDFGIAQASDADTSLTATGMVIGTPAYMSPEQIAGDKVTAAADQYAFGLLVYYALSERLPFEEHSSHALMMAKISKQPPPLSTHLRTSTPALDAFVARMIAVDPTQRFASMDEVADILGRLTSVASPGASPRH